jgi:hypothetical protein
MIHFDPAFDGQAGWIFERIVLVGKSRACP